VDGARHFVSSIVAVKSLPQVLLAAQVERVGRAVQVAQEEVAAVAHTGQASSTSADGVAPTIIMVVEAAVAVLLVVVVVTAVVVTLAGLPLAVKVVVVTAVVVTLAGLPLAVKAVEAAVVAP